MASGTRVKEIEVIGQSSEASSAFLTDLVGESKASPLF